MSSHESQFGRKFIPLGGHSDGATAISVRYSGTLHEVVHVSGGPDAAGGDGGGGDAAGGDGGEPGDGGGDGGLGGPVVRHEATSAASNLL